MIVFSQVEDFVGACHRFNEHLGEFNGTNPDPYAAEDELMGLCDDLEVKANDFIANVFNEDGSDKHVHEAIQPMLDVLNDVRQHAKILAEMLKIASPRLLSSPQSSAVDSPDSSPRIQRRDVESVKFSATLQKRLGKRHVSNALTSKSVRRTSKPPDPTPSINKDNEISVMNNYFGIGLDAKVAMDFGKFRESHPEKCRSRMKNQMWYTVMSTREMMHQTCKNLQTRLVLEVDGKIVQLPKLQGIVVLNIGSYAAGANFWGNKVQKKFRPPSYDDGLLEVVSIRGLTQMAATKTLPGITPTRLAQGRTIRISINPGDDVPIQVDGEAWMQKPCSLTIHHKGRVQMLCRDKAMQKMLKSWKGPELITAEPTHLLSKVEVTKDKLLEAIRTASTEQPGMASNFEIFCRSVEAAGAFLKHGKRGRKVNYKGVVQYLSHITTFIQALHDYINFESESEAEIEARIVASGGTVLPTCLSCVYV